MTIHLMRAVRSASKYRKDVRRLKSRCPLGPVVHSFVDLTDAGCTGVPIHVWEEIKDQVQPCGSFDPGKDWYIADKKMASKYASSDGVVLTVKSKCGTPPEVNGYGQQYWREGTPLVVGEVHEVDSEVANWEMNEVKYVKGLARALAAGFSGEESHELA